MFRDPNVRDPIKAFGPYDLAPIVDRCINCEKHIALYYMSEIGSSNTFKKVNTIYYYSCKKINKLPY